MLLGQKKEGPLILALKQGPVESDLPNESVELRRLASPSLTLNSSLRILIAFSLSMLQVHVGAWKLNPNTAP